MKHKNRLFLIPLVLVLLVYGYSVATAAPAAHHHRWTPGCNTRVHTVQVFSHGAGHVADIYEQGTVCWGHKGLLTSSSVKISTPKNTWRGRAALLNWDVTQPTFQTSGNAKQFRNYEKDFEAHPCLHIPYIGSVCTRSATFAVPVSNYAPAVTSQYPHHGVTIFGLPYCTNDWCAKSGHITFKQSSDV